MGFYASVCLSVCMYVCLPACLFACLRACLSVCLYICLSVCLSVDLSCLLIGNTRMIKDIDFWWVYCSGSTAIWVLISTQVAGSQIIQGGGRNQPCLGCRFLVRLTRVSNHSLGGTERCLMCSGRRRRRWRLVPSPVACGVRCRTRAVQVLLLVVPHPSHTHAFPPPLPGGCCSRRRVRALGDIKVHLLLGDELLVVIVGGFSRR